MPDRRAFINGRVSKPNQIIQSKESIREIALLVNLTRQDGFKTNFTSASVEQWLEKIQSGIEPPGKIEDGEVIVDCQDLGMSGTLDEDERPGLAHLKKCLEYGEIGAIYVTEGVSRLSRDPDRIIPRTLLKLMKQSNCKLRTPYEVLSPCIERDWQQIDEDFEQASKELKTLRRRLHERKMRKSERGEYVGGLVPPGFYLPITGHKSDGSYVFGKLELYPPHAEVNVIVLKELIHWRSRLLAARALRAKHIVYPFFPPELSYMNTRCSIKRSPRIEAENGWAITSEIIRGLATNPKQIGIWISGDKVIKDNHTSLFQGELLDLWAQAYEIVHNDEPKHRVTGYEPLPFAGLLYCANHNELNPLISCNTEGRFSCTKGYKLGAQICFDVVSHLITDPLTNVFLERFNPFPYVEAMLRQVETEMKQGNLESKKYEQEIIKHKQRLANLRASLGHQDRRKDDIILEEITKEERAIAALERRAWEIHKTNPIPINIGRIREFLWRLWQNWDGYPGRLRNEILHLFIDRVELHHERKLIEATIVWKSGERQVILIDRPKARFARELCWRPEEDNLVKLLWPSSSRKAVFAALPERSYKAISGRAIRLGVRRVREPSRLGAAKHWSEHENAELKRLYEAGVSVREISAQLGRNESAISNKASVLKLRRLHKVKYNHLESTYRQPIESLNGSNEESSRQLPFP